MPACSECHVTVARARVCLSRRRCGEPLALLTATFTPHVCCARDALAPPAPSSPCCAVMRPQRKFAEDSAVAVQGKLALQSLPIRAYLDQTVVPVLLQGLSALTKERCVAPSH